MKTFKIFGIKIRIGEESKFTQQNSIERTNKKDIDSVVKDIVGVDVSCPFMNADSDYKLVNIEKLKLFITKNNLARYNYIKTKRDCDDFSYMLQGDVTHWDSDLAFGIIWGYKPNGYGHAWNWCMSTEKEIWFIEPQTNKVFKPKEIWRITKLEM